MTNNVGLAFSVGANIPQFTISNRARQLALVTLDIIFSGDPTLNTSLEKFSQK